MNLNSVRFKYLKLLKKERFVFVLNEDIHALGLKWLTVDRHVRSYIMGHDPAVAKLYMY